MSAPTQAQRYLAECLHRAIPETPERWTPGRYRCPVCSKTPTDKRLVVGYNDQTREAWFTCHGGCDRAALRSALGIRSMAMLRDPGSGAGATPAGEFTYTDEHGHPMFKVARWVDPASRRYSIRADDGGWAWAPKGWRRPYVLYRADEVQEAILGGEVVYLCATEADADAVHQTGEVGTAVSEPTSEGGLRTEYCEILRGAKVRVVGAKSDGGRQRAVRWAAALSTRAEDPTAWEPAGNADVTTLRSHLAAGFELDDLTPLKSGGDKTGQREELPPRCALEQVEKHFKVLLERGDLEVLRAVLACYEANRYLGGDPVWLGAVGGSATGKTETVTGLGRCPGVIVTSTISGEPALLSGTPDKDRAADATGGLLRSLGDNGVLVLKDFTSILSMNRDKRGQVLAALREIFDGHWDRPIGGEGGRTLEWTGKLGLVMACTTAYDQAHGVISVMGDRFILIRVEDDDPKQSMLAALGIAGQERETREAFASACAGLLGHPPDRPPLEATTDDLNQLADFANLITQARSPVARDYQGEVVQVMDREGPARFGKQLYALWRACGMLGMDRDAAWRVTARVVRDSLPKLRWRVVEALTVADEELSTRQVAGRIWHPYKTTKRTLEDLTAHRIVRRRHAAANTDMWRLTEDAKRVVAAILERGPGMSPPLVEEMQDDAIDPEPTPEPTLLDDPEDEP
jgi:hypothetical protein